MAGDQKENAVVKKEKKKKANNRWGETVSTNFSKNKTMFRKKNSVMRT